MGSVQKYWDSFHLELNFKTAEMRPLQTSYHAIIRLTSSRALGPQMVRLKSGSQFSHSHIHKLPIPRIRAFSSTPPPPPSSEEPKQELSQKDKLKRAVKDYGSTVIVFHIAQ